MYELILVSNSPRRKHILQKAGFLFRASSVKISEIIKENINLTDALIEVSRQKSEAYLKQHKSLKKQKGLLLTADTVVVFQGKVLGKPKNFSQALEFLSCESITSNHEVYI